MLPHGITLCLRLWLIHAHSYIYIYLSFSWGPVQTRTPAGFLNGQTVCKEYSKGCRVFICHPQLWDRRDHAPAPNVMGPTLMPRILVNVFYAWSQVLQRFKFNLPQLPCADIWTFFNLQLWFFFSQKFYKFSLTYVIELSPGPGLCPSPKMLNIIVEMFDYPTRPWLKKKKKLREYRMGNILTLKDRCDFPRVL